MKVKKSTKRAPPAPPDVVKYIDSVAKASDAELIPTLERLDVWRFPRSDLHHWIPVLDRFDDILEAIIKSYGLDKPQVNPFTPKDKDLLLQIFRFLRLLEENCTSRKLFSSYDRCCDLLLTTDLDVLQAVLVVVLRPAQSYLHRTPVDNHPKLMHRLLMLIRGWDKLKLATVATADDFTPEPASITFYPRAAASKDGSVTLDLSGVATVDDLATLAEDQGMPLEDHFAALNLLRLSHMRDKGERQQLLGIRLLALAIYVCLTKEDLNSVFLYEPDLVGQIAELLPLQIDIAPALMAMESMNRQKFKASEVISSISINSNHGVLMNLLKSLPERPHGVVDAMLSFLGSLSTNLNHANALIGAGALGVLLDLLSISHHRANYIPRICGLIDILIYNSQQGMTAFSTADGVNIMVARLKDEEPLQESGIVSPESMLGYCMSPLKALLRSIHHLMQASGGSEGMRNLVDGDLPKTIRRIFQNHEKYGPRVYSIAINVFAAFINNEPTSLSILQELQLPQTLYTQLDAGVPSSTDVLAAAINAIGAICLNQSGLDMTIGHGKVIINILTTAVNLDEGSQTIGGALEELARHQPPIRPIIEKAAVDLLRTLIDEAKTFVPEDASGYRLEHIVTDGETPTPTNQYVERFARIFQMFEGFARKGQTCKNLIDAGFMDLLLAVPSLPCIPIRYGTSEAAMHFSHLLRVLMEHDHVVTADAIISAVSTGLEATKQLWSPDGYPRWVEFHEGTALPENLDLFHQLRSVALMLTYLGESIINVSFSHSRVATALIHSLRKAPDFIQNFGSLHQMAARVHAAYISTPADATLLETINSENGKESGAKFLATRIHVISSKFFRSAIKLLYIKRSDSSHAKEAKKLADMIADVLIGHLEQEDERAPVGGTVTLGLCGIMLFDERITDGHINTLLFLAFEKRGGLEKLANTISSITDFMDHHSTDVKGVAAVRLSVTILAALVSFRALIESMQTAALATTFDAPALLVKTRLRLLPCLQRIWLAEWLPTAPAAIVKSTIRAKLSIVEAKGETDAEAPAPVVALPRARAMASQILVNQIVDMGFGRGAAELALQRAHNNIAGAIELMMNAPHIYADIPEPPAAPAAEVNTETSEESSDPDAQPKKDPSVKAQLDEERKDSDLAERSIQLLDHSEDIVFDIIPAMPTAPEGVTFLLDKLLESVTGYDKEREAALSARLRLAVVYMQKGDSLRGESLSKATTILSSLAPVLIRDESLPRWTSPMLLFGETVLNLSTSITQVKLGDEPTQLVSQPDLSVLRGELGRVSIKLVKTPCERNELLSALRMLVILSRQDVSVYEYLSELLSLFAERGDRLRGCQPLLALILRHAFEDDATLAVVIRREIDAWMLPTRSKVVDINHFIKQVKQVALRSPQQFITAVQADCTLQDPTPETAVFHIKSKVTVEKVEEADPFTEVPTNDTGRAVMTGLLTELFKAVESARADANSLTYVGMLISLVTEMVGSYLPAKTLFIRGLPKGIPHLVSDLVADLTLQDVATPSSASTPTTLSRWASSMLIGLCADLAPTADIKELSEELIAVRKQVLDAIIKSIKDTSVTDPNQRYGRLYALGELIFRLLISRTSVGTRNDESGTHMAKIMIEKNLVGVLTTAAGEVDLNYPGIRDVLASLLKALEHLSRLSIKWGKAEKKKAISDESSESSMEISEDEHEAPDLYRNSALGIIGGEIDDEDDEEEDEDEDDDEMMPFDDDVMDGTDDGSDDEMDDEGDWTDEDDEGQEEEDDDDEEAELESVNDEPLEPGLVPVVVPEAIPAWNDPADEDDEEMYDEEEMEDGYEEEMYDDEMDIMEEEEAYELDMLEDAELDDVPVPVTLGPWGWEQPQPESSRSPYSRLLDQETQPAPTMPSHPLLAPPPLASLPARRPRGYGGPNGINELFRHIEASGATEALAALEALTSHRHHPGDPMRIDLSEDPEGAVSLRIGNRHFHIPAAPRTPTPTQDISTEYIPRSTMQRWLEEYQITPARDGTLLSNLVMHLVNRLMPEAKKLAEEDEKKRKAEEAENQRQAEEERAKLAEEAEKARVADEERRQAEVEAAAEIALPESRSTPPAAEQDVEMAVAEPPAESESLARTLIQIHGADVDITDTGIDLEFLQALPDDMRAEVVEQHLREQNRHRRPDSLTAAPEASSQINSEFLDALPPSIRAEVLMQEALDHARRSRTTTAAAPPPVTTHPADPAVDPLALFGDLLNSMSNATTGLRMPLIPRLAPSGQQQTAPVRKSHRESLQLLDKNGIASLLRLLFFPEPFRKSYLFSILVNLCENSATRADLLNLLLSVVQDGSGDLPAVDRSFQQMSLRPGVTPKVTPKTKASETPGPVPLPIFAHLQSERIPTFIAQRCFEALTAIVTVNQQAVTFFLTEHEQAVGLRKPPNKKGKGKEKMLPQTKFPIVILLGLLDRPALLKSNTMMEPISHLLQVITRPLTTIKPKEETAGADEPASGPVAPAPQLMPAPAPVATPGIASSSTPTQSASLVPPETTLSKLPVIPNAVLCLVVNCITVGECSGRTFSNSLMLMQNLCSDPSNKEVILQEICSRVRDTGNIVQGELTELLASIKADTGEALVAAKFSPASSSQAQLLRLLKSIDYLYTNKVDSDAPVDTLSEPEQKVGEIFASFDFAAVWEALGSCLSAVSESAGQLATSLLPMVEALMVVCKYHARLADIRSPEPGSDLFVAFTTAHRKVLNVIVRNNPALLSGSFSLLVRNPKVLEFDNKRNWFFQKLKRKRDQTTGGPLHLNVRRQYVFEDSYQGLQRKTGEEVKYGRLNVKFTNEDGVDAGGVTREWYSVLARQIFDPNFALFEPCAADAQTYQPNKHSSVNGEHLSYFTFVGRVIGKSIYDGRLLDAYFSRAFYKQILGRTVDLRDLESIDPEYHKSMQWMLENDITGVIDQEFTIEVEQFGEKRIVELREGGAKIPVTEENKQEYVRLVVSYRLDNSIKQQIAAFLKGFYDIIPRHLIQIFEPDQLELLISGITTVDVDELKNATQLSGWKSSDPEINWFWRALRAFSQEERSRFLMFVTSSSRVPLGGYTQLQGASGIQPFQIQKLYAKEGSLPQASTCFNLLLLPQYESYEQLKEKLSFAVTETGGFGKA